MRGSPDEITGELVEGGGEIVVSVRIPSAGSAVSRDLRQRVVLSRDEVSGISVRELDRVRTAAFAVSAVAVATTAVIAALSGPSGGSREDPGPPETEEGAVLPAWSDGLSLIPLVLGRSPP